MIRRRSATPWITLHLLAVLVTVCSPAESLTPILTTPGEHAVVLFMDLQTEATDSGGVNSYGNVSDVNVEVSSDVNNVIPLLLGAVNIVDRIRAEANLSLGLAVYDSSGPLSGTLRLLAGLVSDVDNTPSAVITMSSAEVTSAISSMLLPLGVHHVVLSSDDVENNLDEEKKQVIPLYPTSRVKAALMLLEAMNISFVVTKAPSGSDVAQREATQFEQIVHDSSQLCLVSSAVQDGHPTPVVFTGEGDDGEINAVIADGDSAVVVVVGDGYEDLVNNISNTVLLVREKVNESEVENMVLINMTDSPSGIPNPLKASLCTSFHVETSNRTVSNNACILKSPTVRRLKALSDALAFVAAEILREDNHTEPMAWVVSDAEFPVPLEQLLVDKSVDAQPRKEIYEVAVFEKGQFSESADIIDVYDTVTVPRFLHRRDFSNHCDVNCHLCDVCVPKMTSDQKIMLSSAMEEKSVVIVGLFPISRSRNAKENDCSVENTEGLEAAHWFLNTVEDYKDKHASALPNITVGGVVLDTCGQKDLAKSIPRDIDTCFTAYKDFTDADVVIQPSQVIAYVDYKNYVEHSELDKPLMAISDDEYSLSKDAHIIYLHQMTNVLVTLEWLYLRIVIPDEYTYRPDVYQILRSKGLCVAEEILVTDTNLDATVLRLLSSDSAVLFLTDHPTTLEILQAIHSRNSSSNLRTFFMPWNSDVIQAAPRSFSTDIGIITEHVMPESFVFPRSRDIPDPWRGSLERVFTNQASRLKGLSIVPLAVESLMESLALVYNALCPEGRGVCKAMENSKTLMGMMTEKKGKGVSYFSRHELDVFAIRERSKIKIGRVDLQSKIQMNEMSIKDIRASRCTGWCPQCLACSSSVTTHAPSARTGSCATLSATSFPSGTAYPSNRLRHQLQPIVTIPGELLIAGIFPVHRAGKDSFACGGFVNTLEEKRAEEAFLFAVESAKRRYSNLLPGIHIGGILFDSCSDLATSLHLLGRFESCELNEELAKEGKNASFFSPVQVVGYVLQDDIDRASILRDTVRGLKKMATISSLHRMNEGQASLESPQRLTVDAILSLFTEFEWGHAYILTSEDEEFMDMAEYFMDEAGYRGVCVVRYLQLVTGSGNVGRLAEILSDTSSQFVPVILFLTRADAVALFRDRNVGGVMRPWVISMIGDDWLSTVGINIPWGALLIDVQGKVNDDFQVFLEQFSTFSQTPLPPWWRDYLRIRLGCRTSYSDSPLVTPPSEELCQENPLLRGPMYPSAPASRVIKGVDSLLHALDARYKMKCPKRVGICRNLSRDIVGGRLRLADGSFMYEEGMISFEQNGHMEVTLSVISYQPGQLVMAGTYRSTGLSINTSLVQFFTSRGQLLPQSRPLTRCPSCTCINVVTNVTQPPPPSTPLPPALAKWLWQEERGVFIREVWAWTVLSIAVGGAAITMIFIFYVMFKVWQGALARRYIGLGLVLLVSISLLYLSALPFVFTPSLSVCGLRYLYPALALCLCLACVLVKLMALQDYRTIGLGGELCGLNQALCVFFILLVQVSISVQWWLFNKPFLQETLDRREDVVKFSCLFQPRDFVLNLCFVIFLIVLCAFYSLSVRKEKKNMGEAKLLLAGSWAVLVLWMGWVPVLLLLRDRFASVVCCGGILGTASALLLVVFVPKVRMVARLKYDIAKKQAVRNGYSIDTDFLYERPYSLPGTLTSTYSSIRTYPKSVAATNFDSSLSY